MAGAFLFPVLLCFCPLQPFKKCIIFASIDAPKLDQDACPDVQFTGFVFCICCASDIAAAPLKLCAQLFLRQTAVCAQTAEIVAHIPIPSDFLLHCFTAAHFDQYWLQVHLFYDTMKANIDRYTGRFEEEIMVDYKKLYALLVGAIDDVIYPLSLIPEAMPCAAALQQALEQAEELYLEMTE